jgi:hypothetical protein
LHLRGSNKIREGDCIGVGNKTDLSAYISVEQSAKKFAANLQTENGAASCTSRSRDVECGFHVAGKLCDNLGDFVGFFHQLRLQPPDGFGFEAHDFGGGDDEREVVVHVVAHVGEFFVQLGDLRGGEGDGFAWQSHWEIIAQSGRKSSALSR